MRNFHPLVNVYTGRKKKVGCIFNQHYFNYYFSTSKNNKFKSSIIPLIISIVAFVILSELFRTKMDLYILSIIMSLAVNFVILKSLLSRSSSSNEVFAM